MSQTTSLDTDRAHLMHPLHHPSAYKTRAHLGVR